MKSKQTIVYTDGACFPNPGRGGWAWTTTNGESDSGSLPHTTNNVMELMGPLQALKTLRRPLLIISDSQYFVKGITEWIDNWVKKNFKNVKNPDLWKELYILRAGNSFQWVRGHCGNPGNEEADRLATLACGASQQTIKKCEAFWNAK